MNITNAVYLANTLINDMEKSKSKEDVVAELNAWEYSMQSYQVKGFTTETSATACREDIKDAVSYNKGAGDVMVALIKRLKRIP